jgi:(p)ppGpp synthase/HD superfamily hydrolase
VGQAGAGSRLGRLSHTPLIRIIVIFDPIYLQHPLIASAHAFAFAAHHSIGQVRNYTHEPYISHPEWVAGRVAEIPLATPEMIAAALLHDTVEDVSWVTQRMIDEYFGQEVGMLVENLTDVSRPEDGDRAVRRAIDRAHTALARPEAKTIKCADLLHNTSSILQHDPGFAVIYMKEKQLLLEEALVGACDQQIYDEAKAVVEAYFQALGPKPA